MFVDMQTLTNDDAYKKQLHKFWNSQGLTFNLKVNDIMI